MLDRDEAIVRIRAALKRKTGKTWSVTGGRGTGWGWIDVQAPPKRRINHVLNPEWDVHKLGHEQPNVRRTLDVQPEPGTKGHYTSYAERKQLARAFKLDRTVIHHQGLMISPDERDFYVARVES